MLILGVLVFGMVACQEAGPGIRDIFPKQLNLLQHGIPIAIQAPNDAEVSNRSDNFMQDIVIKGTDFYVQIYSQNATSPSCQTLAGEARADIKLSNRTFQRIVLEESCGFIYEVQAPGDTTKCYNFAYFRVQGNKSFSFSTTTGSRKPFTLDQVTNIYNAIKKE